MPYSPAEDAVGLFPDSRQATHCWNDPGAPPPLLVAVLELAVPVLVELLELAALPSLAAGCDVAEAPSSDVAGAEVGAGAAGPEMGLAPERPSGTFTGWFT
jgi:hypothetical protein